MLSLVIPVYNERDSLRPLVEEIAATCDMLGPWEAIFVDDGSHDGSTEVLRELCAERTEVVLVRLRRNFGKSTALMAGFEAAQGERVVTLDADGQDDPAEIPRLLTKLDEGFTLVSGWKRRRNDPRSKTLPSRLFNRATAAMSGVKLNDFNSGLKVYRTAAARQLRLYGEMYRYVAVLGFQRGWRVSEIEVNHRPRVHGESKFGAERYLRGLFDLVTVVFLGRYRHRPLHLFGVVGGVLLTAGIIILAYLTALKVFGGEGISDRPLLLLGVLLVVVAVQLLSLGLLAELMTISHAEQRGTQLLRESVDEVVRGSHGAPHEAVPEAVPAAPPR